MKELQKVVVETFCLGKNQLFVLFLPSSCAHCFPLVSASTCILIFNCIIFIHINVNWLGDHRIQRHMPWQISLSLSCLKLFDTAFTCLSVRLALIIVPWIYENKNKQNIGKNKALKAAYNSCHLSSSTSLNLL